MSSPTKADLTAAVAKLTAENAGLRDLIAAISEIAGSVPQAVYDQRNKQLDRASSFLVALKVVADPARTWAWGHASGEAAAYLRECAAEPVGYEMYDDTEWRLTAKGEASLSVPNPPYHMTPGTIGPCCVAEDGGYICNAQENHDGPDHVAYGTAGQQCRRWPVAPEAEPLVISDSTIAQAGALAGDIEAGTWPAPAPTGMQSPAPVVRVISDEAAQQVTA